MALFKDSRHDGMKRKKGLLSRDSLVSKAREFFAEEFACSPRGAPKANHNLRKLLNLEKLPSDTSVRYHLDSVDPDKIKPIFKDIFNDLRKNADLSEYRRADGSFLISIDGTQTFSSKKVHCPSFLVKKHRNGSATYSHQIMTAV
ncbi:MAG: hypothetical protein H6618_01285 [Deltaproteobacteria bacterium]|nr:hypothetical protein [Deltaproteobacteria bacterium]